MTYTLVQWPESQLLMEHPRFNECLLIDNIPGHVDVGSSAYMAPSDLADEIFKPIMDDLLADEELMRQSIL